MQHEGLHYPDKVVTFQQIMTWKEEQEEHLTKKQREQALDYLAIKTNVKNKWSKEDKKRVLKVKNFLKQQETPIDQIREVTA